MVCLIGCPAAFREYENANLQLAIDRKSKVNLQDFCGLNCKRVWIVFDGRRGPAAKFFLIRLSAPLVSFSAFIISNGSLPLSARAMSRSFDCFDNFAFCNCRRSVRAALFIRLYFCFFSNLLQHSSSPIDSGALPSCSQCR